MEELEKLFDSQMETLELRGCPETILIKLRVSKDEVLNKSKEMEISEGHIPFIPVIPRSYMGIYGLMSMMTENGRKTAYTCLDDLSIIIDNVKTPKSPYFIYDVECNNKAFVESPRKMEKKFREMNRSGLTIDEGIALCTHTDVLREYYVNCIGSYYDQGNWSDWILSVFLGRNGPKISYDSIDFFSSSDDNEKRRSFSCLGRH